MDYESRKVKWYWLILFCGYCVTVVYLLFQGNPLLYSRQDLRSSLDVAEIVTRLPVPQHPPEIKPTPATAHARYNLERTGDDPLAVPRSKNYTEYERAKVELPEGTEFEFQNVSGDASGFYVTRKSPWALAIGIDGKVRWKYGFKSLPVDRVLPPVLLDENSAYLVHPQGEVVCLDKNTGRLRWSLALREELAAAPIIWHGHLLIPTKNSGGVNFTMVDRANAKIEEDSPHFDFKPGFQLSLAKDPETLIVVVENKVIAIDPAEWSILWTQTLTDPIKGPALTVGNQIYLATLGAKIVKLDGPKKGKLDWEADTVKPPASSPLYLPIMAKLAVMDTSGNISFLDAKTGKVAWRNPTENHTGFSEIWAARLKGSHIEEFKMDWLHKGWTVWSPCYDRHFCIYTPKYGAIVAKIQLTGHPVALPQPVDKRWVFLTQTKAGGPYMVTQVVEDMEIKALKAESEKANP